MNKHPQNVRVMTWNIHGALGHNPRFDLARVITLVRRWNPDVVALQEVDSRRALAGDSFQLLQASLGKHGVKARSITSTDGDYGQMLISCWPIRDGRIHDISWPEREPRRVIGADIEMPGGFLRVVVTHLGLALRERRSQAKKLLDIAGAGVVPTVVMGDFNDWLWPGSVRRVLACAFPGRSRYRTFPSRYPMMRLDRIYCRPKDALVRTFVDPAARDISDHLPVIADIALGTDTLTIRNPPPAADADTDREIRGDLFDAATVCVRVSFGWPRRHDSTRNKRRLSHVVCSEWEAPRLRS